MRQIKDLSKSLTAIGDYAVIDVHDNIDYEGRIVIININLTHSAMYSNDIALNGSSSTPKSQSVLDRFPFLGTYRHTFCQQIGGRSIDVLLRSHSRLRDKIITIIEQDIQLDDISNISPNTDTPQLVAYPNEWVNRNYSQEMMYQGLYGWHHHHGCTLNQPVAKYSKHRFGIELEVEFNNPRLRDEFVDIPSNWFYLETDGSIDRESGCEIITIPLLPKDAKSVDFWQHLTDRLNKRANSWDTNGRCGLHIHISRCILGKNAEEQSETIGKLLYLYHHFVKDTRFNTRMYGRERGYHDHDGKSNAGDAAKLLGGDCLRSKAVSEKVKKEMLSKSYSGCYDNDYRYFDINLQNEHTIEFRRGRGSINPERIAMVIEYCELMCIYAKNTPWTQISFYDFISYLKGCGSEKIKSIIATTVIF